MSTIEESRLSNKDLAPTGPERRTWGTYHLAALIGLMRAQSTAREPATAGVE